MKILTHIKRVSTYLFISVSISYAQQVILTLEESLEMGLKNSKELQISNSKIAGYDAGVSQISSTMLPKLSVKGSYARLSDVPPFQVFLPINPDPAANIKPTPITIQESCLDNYNISV